MLSRHRDRLAVGNGKEDNDNRYQTVVQVAGLNNVLCSGVLVAQRLVLTAAHCFCEITEKPFDKSRNVCRSRTKVTRVFYYYDEEAKKWMNSRDATNGEVVLHGDYAPQRVPGSSVLVVDGKKLPDLAVIRLDRAFIDGFLVKKIRERATPGG
jgi:V8-like Glu-specific endopeptidase